eukprot:TRINITY_DN8842_c0_g1_i5.p1 TRINITY_DN8842_c0_g1~~TRINITY_DN8842_c0_g1_i5.p1  ORF type:complete len:2126 (+),score=535.89 TRINITY_DN8842_c0_g1_i5:64-6441(+)
MAGGRGHGDGAHYEAQIRELAAAPELYVPPAGTDGLAVDAEDTPLQGPVNSVCSVSAAETSQSKQPVWYTGEIDFVNREQKGRWAVLRVEWDKMYPPGTDDGEEESVAELRESRCTGHTESMLLRSAPSMPSQDGEETQVPCEFVFLHHTRISPSFAFSLDHIGEEVTFTLYRSPTDVPDFLTPDRRTGAVIPSPTAMLCADKARFVDPPDQGQSKELRSAWQFMWRYKTNQRQDRLGLNLVQRELADQLSRVSRGEKTRVMQRLGNPLYVLVLSWHLRLTTKADEQLELSKQELPSHEGGRPASRRRGSATGSCAGPKRPDSLTVHVETSGGVIPVYVPVVPPKDRTLLAHLCRLADDARCDCHDECPERGEGPDDERRDDTGTLYAFRQLTVDMIGELNKLWREHEPDEPITVDPVTGELVSVDRFCKDEAQGVLETVLELGQADVLRAMISLQHTEDAPSGIRAAAPTAVWHALRRKQEQETAPREPTERGSPLLSRQGSIPVFELEDRMQAECGQPFAFEDREDFRKHFTTVSRDLWLSTWNTHDRGPVLYDFLERFGLSVTHPDLLNPFLQEVQSVRCNGEVQDAREAIKKLKERYGEECRKDSWVHRSCHGSDAHSLAPFCMEEAERRLASMARGGCEAWAKLESGSTPPGNAGAHPSPMSRPAPVEFSPVITSPHIPPGWDRERDTATGGKVFEGERCLLCPGESRIHYRRRRRNMVLTELLLSQVATPGYDRFGLFPTPFKREVTIQLKGLRPSEGLQGALARFGIDGLNSDGSVRAVRMRDSRGRPTSAAARGLRARSVLVKLGDRAVTARYEAEAQFQNLHGAGRVRLTFAYFGFYRGALATVLQRAPGVLSSRRIANGLSSTIATYVGLEDDVLTAEEMRRFYRLHEDMTQEYSPHFEPCWYPHYVRITRRIGWQVTSHQRVPGREENWCAVGLNLLDWAALLSSETLLMLGARLCAALRENSSAAGGPALANMLREPWSMVRTKQLELASSGSRTQNIESDLEDACESDSRQQIYFRQPRHATYHRSAYLAAYSASMRFGVIRRVVQDYDVTHLFRALDPGALPDPVNLILHYRDGGKEGGKNHEVYLSAQKWITSSWGVSARSRREGNSLRDVQVRHQRPHTGAKDPNAVALCDNVQIFGNSAAAQKWYLWRQKHGHMIYQIQSADSFAALQAAGEDAGTGGETRVLLCARRDPATGQFRVLLLRDDGKPDDGSIRAGDCCEWGIEVVGIKRKGGKPPRARYRIRLEHPSNLYLQRVGSRSGGPAHSSEPYRESPFVANVQSPAFYRDPARVVHEVCLAHARTDAEGDRISWSIPGLALEGDPTEVAVTFGHRETMLTMIDKYQRDPRRWRGKESGFGVWGGDYHDIALLMSLRLKKIDRGRGAAQLERIISDLHSGEKPGTDWVGRKLTKQAPKLGFVMSLPFFLLVFIVTVVGFFITSYDFYNSFQAVSSAVLESEYNPGHEYVATNWRETFEDVDEINVLQEWFKSALLGKVLRDWGAARFEGAELVRGHGGEGRPPYQPGFFGAWRMVGSVRVGQYAVAPGSCSYPSANYAAWLRASEAQFPCYASSGGWTPHYLELNQFHFPLTEDRFPTLSFQQELLLHQADLEWYPDTPFGARPTSPALEQLVNGSWISPMTRYLCVQFVTYNPTLSMFVVAEACFQIMATGQIHPAARFTPCTLEDSSLLSIVVLFFVLGGVLALLEVRDFCSELIADCGEKACPDTCPRWLKRITRFCGRWLVDEGNAYDLVLVALTFLAAVFMLQQEHTRRRLSTEDMMDPANRAFYTDFLRLARETEQVQITISWLIVLCWWKMPMSLRYVPILGPTIYTITAVFTGVSEVYSFVTLFCVYLVTFFLGWYVSHSSYYEDMSTVPKAFTSVFRMMLGDNWEDMIDDSQARPYPSPMLLFIVMVFFITIFFLNIFIAVLQEAYTSVRRPGAYEESLATLWLQFELLVPRSTPYAGGRGRFPGLWRRVRLFFLGPRVTEIDARAAGWAWEQPVSSLAEKQYREESDRIATVAGDVAEIQGKLIQLMMEWQESFRATTDRLSQMREDQLGQGRRITEIQYDLRALGERMHGAKRGPGAPDPLLEAVAPFLDAVGDPERSESVANG